ncbi:MULTISPECIES: sugar ABC transporter permease [Fervidobacterium]|uniref:Binding-protein-dependent transport systems inner membrane component n=2 Tax=Fervidobacterium nodosum TaxID=2424 RepID=A7HK27_FERNB|nr:MULTISPECIES: sugar ABC transporter permease [Fervidobacterium]ABS60260.1 binding-protein-dependent transport systems inner membrane component [Fervidobacterium nodosum Rt17-B1]
MTSANVKKIKEGFLAYLFLLPAMIVLSIFTFWPVGFSFVLSFFKWDFRNMKNPYFYGLGNYKEILKFDYPVKFPFYMGLIYSLMYIAISLILVFAIFGVINVFKKKKIEIGTVLSIISLFVYFIVRNNVILTLAIILDLIFWGVIIANFKTKIIDKQIMKDHAWLASVIGVVFYIITEFKFSAFFKGQSYGIIDYLLDASNKNLFFKALVNTTYYVILTVPIGLTLALLIALLLNNEIKFKAFFRTAFFIPFVTSSVAVGLIWKWIYNDDVGLLNYLLTTLGMQPVKWLKDAKWTIPTVSIVSIWKSVGYNAMIFLAGLQNIDTFYYEAAEVDGANSVQKFFKITWPLLSPTTFFLLIVSVIGAFKVFQEVFILYDGLPGPYGNSGMTMVYYVFDLFYRQQRMGIASAAAYLLFMVILVFTFIQYRVGDKVVEYVS